MAVYHSAEAPIAALATGTGPAAIAIIRVSGAGSHALLAPCLQPGLQPGSEPRAELSSWTMGALRLVRFLDPASGGVIDEPLVVLFRAPRSYTGEDGAEIHAHGGPYVVRRILEVLYAQGFRPAAPGEFTQRAFLNGKLDLTAAEGIRELTQAQSHQQWLAARHLTSGRLRTAIEDLRAELIGALAYIEAQIDFPDEGDTAHLQRQHVRERVGAVVARVRQLIRSYDDGRVASRGLMVALVGAPNAGKSTLFNTLLGRERAFVTPIAGTTRDWLEESCLLDGRLIRLVDMAGVRDDAPDPIEAMGIAAARRLASEADLVLFLVAGAGDHAGDPQQVETWRREMVAAKAVKIATKCDLGVPDWATPDWLCLSCQLGSGLEELRRELIRQVDAHVGSLDAEAAFVTSARHRAALQAAAVALNAFERADQSGAYEEMLAFELQVASQALRTIVGEVGNEDILSRIFSDFCIGK